MLWQMCSVDIEATKKKIAKATGAFGTLHYRNSLHNYFVGELYVVDDFSKVLDMKL